MKMFFYLILSFSLLPLNAQTVSNTIVLENAQKPQMTRWTIEGPIMESTSVDYITGEKGRGSVVKLQGLGLNNRFVFRGEKGASLDTTGKTVLQWKMRYKEPFIADIEITTSEGIKHILYSDLNERVNNGDSYLHIGIGTRFNDNNWHTVTRDIQQDLNSMVPHVKLKNINYISFRGSGFIDDIKIMDKESPDITVASAKYGTKNWKRLGKGGTINIEHDPVLGEAIRFDSGPKQNTFQLKKSNGIWDLTLTPVVQWKMKMLADYKIYFIIEAAKSKYILVYDDSNQSRLYNPKTKMIHYGLGYYSVDNQWHSITRDINEDLKRVFPNVDPLRIGGVLIKGKGSISDIKLLTDKPGSLDVPKGWEVYDNDPKGAVVKSVNDLEKGEVAEFSGDSLKNGYKYSGEKGALYESSDKPFVRWAMRFSEIFDIMLAVESNGVVHYIHYVSMPTDYNRIKDGELYIGLGDTQTDRRWHTVTRDLSSDIKFLSSTASYSSCKYILVRGSGRVGNIEFFERFPEQDKKVTPSTSSSVVIGQYSFGHNLKNLWGDVALKNNGMNSPYSVVADSEGKIYISDSENNRIMVWKKIPENYGANADEILNTGLKNPTGLFIYKKKLFVADTDNNRILMFDLPIDDSSTPKMVLEGHFNNPKAVFYDGTRLFVADTGNNRVLIWNEMPIKGSKDFDVVLGQSSVSGALPNKGKSTPSFNTMNMPSSIFSDGTSLYVADTGNNRVLLFKEIPTMNGWHADVVIGQNNFKSDKPNKGEKTSESSLSAPQDVFVADGKLYVCDTTNNRVLLFNIDTDLNSAEGLIGQSVFRSSTINAPAGIPSSYSLFAPTSVFVKDGIIYIADKNNNRALVY